ncbi:hypothetical protein GCM10007425_12750 [Lysinibacillus alkalisoli]|uniref:Uncharacterized protein n=1 Tax=Lysinibacillus alkalisoli TaxID=1911548 RepID=A0A917G398_9BACI|nr:hypothetical protein [Lysinibacillus alkalisoli]GGG19782.1 hypothetical protein GCM10007425_12750 [Lysinibacillus alkalisoli]
MDVYLKEPLLNKKGEELTKVIDKEGGEKSYLLSFSAESITGKHMMQAEKKYREEGGSDYVPVLTSMPYRAALVAVVLDVDYEAIAGLSGVAYFALTTAVQDFFF